MKYLTIDEIVAANQMTESSELIFNLEYSLDFPTYHKDMQDYRKVLYIQCTIKKNNSVTVSYIPKNFAIKGKEIQIWNTNIKAYEDWIVINPGTEEVTYDYVLNINEQYHRMEHNCLYPSTKMEITIEDIKEFERNKLNIKDDFSLINKDK